MFFSQQERRAMLALKGVGPAVIARLEQMGFMSLAQLRKAHVQDILARGAQITGASCWKNSPQAQAAVAAVIALAKERHET